MTQVGKISINFNTFSNSPSHIAISDLSDWAYAESLPSYVLITIPGSKNPKTFSFKKFKTNIFNSHNLGLSCFTGDCGEQNFIDIPDGIYTICLKSGYEDIEHSQYYLKTDRFEVEYAKVLIKYGTENVEENFIKQMIQVKYTLDVAKSHAMFGDFVKANRYFQEANKILKRFVDCKNCL